jgi:hypothetical protein
MITAIEIALAVIGLAGIVWAVGHPNTSIATRVIAIVFGIAALLVVACLHAHDCPREDSL